MILIAVLAPPIAGAAYFARKGGLDESDSEVMLGLCLPAMVVGLILVSTWRRKWIADRRRKGS